ncbi:ROK family protein [Capillimicrobium parvum]|uniref:N-acetyl-D-glucosamine kinase n=1 Tax=Capillimicrobium parvum TaxID=2884022 RepID=A0A9E6Y2V3_9ACTN|nr:ROK family protein [Capillimicrobium parvum]UGS39035.1 N-acetyl-D-glucosamine kinase [Capillimicrobium parvum]
MVEPETRPRGGIDLGGTKIQAIVADADHKVLGEARQPTPTTGGPQDVINALADVMRQACVGAGLNADELGGVGLGSPGDIDARQGTIAQAGNLPNWTGAVPVAEMLGAALGTSVAIGNDVSVATRAEFELGAGKPYGSLLGVFWGTGVGGGLILDGKEWEGRAAAGEIGHMVVKRGGALCPCGRHGCMEAYAGRKAMEVEARRRHDEGEHTDLFKIMKERGRDRLTSGVWERALKHGDQLAEHLFERAYLALGAGVASAINLLDVEAVVLGGGLGVRFGDAAAARLAEAMRPHLFNDDRPPAVAVAALGDYGGALGAAMLVGP